MGAPRTSRYRNLFDAIPPEFLEDITIIHRFQTGQDDYKHPTFSTIEEDVTGRFEILNQPDRIPEEGGLRPTTQARIFLKLPLNFDDQFQYVGAPDPGLWTIQDGDPTVDGEYLLLEPLFVGPPEANIVISNDLMLFGEVEFRIDLSAGVFNGANFGLSYPGGFRAYFVVTSSTTLEVVSQNGGAQEFDSLTVPALTVDKYKIVWARDKVEFYLNDGLIKTFSVEVPQRPLQVIISGGSTGPGPVKVDYAKTEADDILETAQFRVREKVWAQVKTEYTTHLQREYLVQEAIP